MSYELGENPTSILQYILGNYSRAFKVEVIGFLVSTLKLCLMYSERKIS